jgi:hypothetical protein
MKPKRLYLFYDRHGRLVWQIPWPDIEPPYLIEAKEPGLPDDELAEVGDGETVH